MTGLTKGLEQTLGNRVVRGPPFRVPLHAQVEAGRRGLAEGLDHAIGRMGLGAQAGGQGLHALAVQAVDHHATATAPGVEHLRRQALEDLRQPPPRHHGDGVGQIKLFVDRQGLVAAVVHQPRLFVHGLSLGAMNSERSVNLFDMIDTPIDGALLAAYTDMSADVARIRKNRAERRRKMMEQQNKS